MDVKAAAARLEISISLMYSLIAEGRISCRRVGRAGRRGKIVIREDDIRRFEESVKIEANGEA